MSTISGNIDPSLRQIFHIELYHNDMSACAQKVRFAVAEIKLSYLPLMKEKGLESRDKMKAAVGA